MTLILRSSVSHCRRAARFVFRACFGAQADQQLWRWMLPREQDESHAESQQV